VNPKSRTPQKRVGTGRMAGLAYSPLPPIKGTTLTYYNRPTTTITNTTKNMANPFAIAAAGAGILGGIFSSFGAGRRARSAERQSRMYQQRLDNFQQQEIINPYANVKDLSNMITNPARDMQVATRAAELQAEGTDLSLATGLEALRETGGGASSATAILQQANAAKLQIAGNVQQQEAAIAIQRARGEQMANQQRMQEAIRLQGADVAGQQFMFNVREQRDNIKMDRLQGMADRYANMAGQYRQAQQSALGTAFGNLAGLGMKGLFN
jgi:hypothetical protein